MAADPFAATLDGTSELWGRLARPFDVGPTVEAFLGLSTDVVEQLTGVLVATCNEAEHLLATMPQTLRNLKTAIGSNDQRCVGELRGPVLWSATMAAQASSLGSADVFVCASPHRAYDIDENQVLVAALRAVTAAGRAADRVDDESYDDEGLRRAHHNSRLARRYLEHRTLSQVRLDGMPSRRAINRTRGGKSTVTYGPALSMLIRSREPLGLEELAPYCDRRTRVQHAVLLGVIEEIERRGLRVPSLRAESGSLFAGPVEYVHPRRRGDRSRAHGIIIGGLLADVPEKLSDRQRETAQADLVARAHGRQAIAIVETDDIVRAVDAAILAARTT